MDNLRRRNGGSLYLNKYSLTVEPAAGSITITVYSQGIILKDSSVTVSSSQYFATPSYSSSSGQVTVLYEANTDTTSNRTTYIYVNYKGLKSTFKLTQKKKIDDGRVIVNGYTAVDFGLSSGLKWGTCDIGSSDEYTAGNLYKYGAVVAGDNGTCVTDHDTLSLEEDAVHAVCGGTWRMPTREEVRELLNATNAYSYATSSAKGYYKIVSKTNSNKYIIVPASVGMNSGYSSPTFAARWKNDALSASNGVYPYPWTIAKKSSTGEQASINVMPQVLYASDSVRLCIRGVCT